MTISTLFSAYLSEHLLGLKESSHGSYRSHARILVAELGDPEAQNLAARDLRLYFLQLRGRLRGGSISHRLSFVKTALAWAVREGHIEDNVAAGIQNAVGPNARHRYLGRNEEEALRQIMPGPAFSLVRFALLTGLRRLEIFNIRPDDINWDARQLLITDSKTNTQRIVPLNAEAMIIADKWRKRGQPYLFKSDFGAGLPSCAKRFKAAKYWSDRRFYPYVSGADIKNFHFHDLRHTFASRLVQNSVPLYTVQTLLGHSKPEMTQRYAHLSDHNLRNAVDGLN